MGRFPKNRGIYPKNGMVKKNLSLFCGDFLPYVYVNSFSSCCWTGELATTRGQGLGTLSTLKPDLGT